MRGGKQPKLLRGRAEGGQEETGVLLLALLRNGRGSRLERLGLGARGTLRVISASSGAKIDIETEGSKQETGRRRETSYLLDQAQ